MYFYKKINEFRLIFHLICVDCQQEENFHFSLGDLFNIEGNLILSEADQINFSHRTCQGCKNFILIDFKKVFSCEQIRKIYNDILSVEKKNKMKIKNLLPKDSEIFKTSGEIILRKFDEYFPARVGLWPQNHPAAPPAPVVSDDDTTDSTYDCQCIFFSAKKKLI